MHASRKLAGVALALAVLMGTASCSGGGSDAAATTSTTKPAGKVKVNTDDADNPTVEYTDKNGTKTEFGASLPQGWPSALAPPKSISIVSSSTSQADGKTQLFVTGTSTESYDAVHQGIKDQLTAAGLKITSDLSTDGDQFAGVEAKGQGISASVTISADPDTKKVTVLYTVTPKD